jgi:iron complex transport system substrate-binding protein
MKKYIFIALLSLFSLACNRFGNKAKENADSQRIVCISKQYSEIIFALNAQKNIVAVDLSSTFPPAIKQLPTVGYHRALSTETIMAMKPSLILHDNNIGPEHVVTQLNQLKVPMKVFGKYQHNIDGTDSLIREMGAYFGKVSKADSICKKLHADMAMALTKTQNAVTQPRVLIIHFGRASNVYLVMTKKSTAAKMVEWAGGIMAVEADKGMKQLSPELIAAANPDVILLTDFGYDRLENGQQIQQLPGISSTNAFKNKRIFRIEEHDLVYLGPRTGENVLLLNQLIHQNEKL